MNWICKGEPQNTGYLHLTGSPHKPIKNTGKFCTGCGLLREAVDSKITPSLNRAPIKPEKLLDRRYKIIDFLAKGGFGETYRAADTRRFDSLCFIKQLKPAYADETAALQIALDVCSILRLKL